ncbi:MAG: GAK system XXXCH domain-containing protein [Deltaproteobacteria bacterium]|nr:GAK system XXXCH domain-containing protein [Deltaproteobacteria bacterium]
MEHKIKKSLSREELGDYLHTLADAVQNAVEVHDQRLAILQTAFEKLELKCKRETKGFGLTLKLKADSRGLSSKGKTPPATTHPAGSYRALKKEMQTTFKQIGAKITANQIPDAPLIRTFQKEIRAMVRYPDRGEPHYEAFEAACRRLVGACQNNRMDDMRQAYEALKRMKKDCHARYK